MESPQPNTIFNWLEVVPIPLISPEAKEEFIISYTQDDKSDLYNELKELRNKSKPYEKLVNKATKIVEDKEVISTVNQFNLSYPGFAEVFDWLSKNIKTLDKQSILNRVIDGYGDSKSDAWDALLIQSILKDNPSLLEHLCMALRLINLFRKVLEDDPILDANIGIQKVWNAQVVLPNDIFPIPRPVDSPDFPEPDIDDHNNAEIIEKNQRLQIAKKEILDVFSTQQEGKRAKNLSFSEFRKRYESTQNSEAPSDGQASNNSIVNDDEPDPISEAYNAYLRRDEAENLDEDIIKDLSSQTKEALQDMNLSEEDSINIPYAVNKIDQTIFENNKSVRINRFNRGRQIIRVGSTILSFNGLNNDNIICEEEPKLTHCELLKDLTKNNPEKPIVNILGIGDLNVIRQELLKYELGEVAHIENVLSGEMKSRTHRNLKRTEDTFEIETENLEETETDTKSTEQFELSKAIDEEISKATQKEAGVSVSGGFGPVNVSAHASYASQTSQSSATSSASKYAKEVVESAKKKVENRVRESRINKTINEVEVINEHKLNNTGTDNLAGVYRFVDKYYLHKVINLGKRLMLEFWVMEPAAFYIYCQSQRKTEGVSVEEPIPPNLFKDDTLGLEPLTSFDKVNESNYALYANIYAATDNIAPPPQEFIRVSGSFDATNEKTTVLSGTMELDIPSGYKAYKGAFGAIAGPNWIKALPNEWYYDSNLHRTIHFNFDQNNELIDKYKIPYLLDVSTAHMAYFHLDCKRTNNSYKKWQIDTFNSIKQGYLQQKAEFDNQMAALEISAGINITGNNPAINEKVTREQLKKSCIELLTLQRFDGLNAVKQAQSGFPEMDFVEAEKECKVVRFFEEICDWKNMTYLFYPFYWGRKTRWQIIKQLNDNDPKFQDFLQAGAARVVVPCQLDREDEMLHYLETCEIWNGQGLPGLNDPNYLSITQALKDAKTDIGEDGDEIDSFISKVPTNLVMLQSVEEGLPDFSDELLI